MQILSGMGMMMRVLTSLAALALLGATPASAATYVFSGGGFADGATFSGSFTGEDSDNDGQISSFTGEVSAFSGIFSGNSYVTPLTFGLGDLMSLVWDLDAFLGDGIGGPSFEGLWAENGTGYFMIGAGAYVACDGANPCAEVTDGAGYDDSFAPLSVAIHTPEPGTWAMMLAGFGMIGAALRRPRRRLAPHTA